MAGKSGRHWVCGAAIALALAAGCKDERPKTGPPAPPASAPARTGTDAALAGANNRGVAWMEACNFSEAINVFAPLAQAHPGNADVQVNHAVALLNRQGPGDAEAATEVLDKVLARDPAHPRAQYCKALLLLNRGAPAEAIVLFESVAAADPKDAYAAYYVGQCRFAQGHVAEALQSYERAIAIDPHLRSAHYGAFQCLQRLQRPDEAQSRLGEFQKLRDNPQARLAEFKYTRTGTKGEVVAIGADAPAPRPLPAGPLFADPTPLPLVNATAAKWITTTDSGAGRVGITAADIDGDDKLDVFITRALAGDSGVRNAVLLQRGTGFEVAPEHPLAGVPDVNAAAWGDFDNDGRTDVYLARKGPGQMWRQAAKNQWEDVTGATGTSAGHFDTVDAKAFDADHDGDLDLFLVRRDGPNELLNNNLDGTFRPIAERGGLVGRGGGSVGVVAADLNHDRVVDIMVLKAHPPHEVFYNDRLWNYRAATAPSDPLTQLPAEAAVVADADCDGRLEVYQTAGGVLTRLAPGEAGAWTPAELAKATATRPQLAVADVDGSGTLAVVHGDGGAWAVSGTQPGALPKYIAKVESPLRAWSLVMLDAGAGPSVIGLPQDGPPLIWRPGAGRQPFVALSFSGKHRMSDQMRSNASGVGVRAAARAGARWTALHSYPAHASGHGQSRQPFALGLNGLKQMDFVELSWPDGLRQTESNLEAGKLHRFEEVQRQASGSPVLFAWDGSKFAFVTDCLGAGGIGLATGEPGEYAPPRPAENLLLPLEALAPRDGRLALKLAEPMEAACYLDAASLVAWDLPPGCSMTLDERMGVNDPQPTGAPRFFRRQISPVRAENERGQDVTTRVVDADGTAPYPGIHDPRFIGLRSDHALTLTFPLPINDGPGEPFLLADGWVERPYSQTTFAAWQAGKTYQAPSLDAWDGERWVVVLEQFGYPAGMPRQMSANLPRERLPRGTTRLRLRTNREIYWDRIAVAWAEPYPAARSHPLPLREARVMETGFPPRTDGPQRRPQYAYDRRVPLSEARYQDGFYTEFGRANPLVEQVDDAFAVFGPGEEVHLEFDAPPAPPGQDRRRWFVLQLNGWCKDRDPYTEGGQSLEPLPSRDDATPESLKRRDALHQQFNTRFRSGG